MAKLDLRTSVWLDEIGLFCSGNTYDPAKLRDSVQQPTEWSKRLQRNFQYVLANHSVTVIDYETRTDIDFDSDEELFSYLERLYDYLFEDGPFPDWE